jgi:hypothetical protein
LRTVVKPARRVRRDGSQHPGRRIVLHLGQAGVLAAPAHQEVDLHVHQTGQQDGVAEIDDVAFVSTTNTYDPIAFDPNDSRPDDLTLVDIDQTRCFEGQHRQTTGSLTSWM